MLGKDIVLVVAMNRAGGDCQIFSFIKFLES